MRNSCRRNRATKNPPTSRRKGERKNQTQVALPNGGNFDYNSIKTVAASGNVKASYTNKQGETSNAQAEKITYNAKTGEIILTGAPVIVTPDVIVKIRTRMLSFECTPTETCTAAAEPRPRSAT